MYTSIYVYRIPMEHVEHFLRIQQEAAEIYRRLGAIDDTTLQAHQLAAKYSCLPFTANFLLTDNEVLMIGMSYFHDQSHHDDVMRLADSDPRLDELYHEVASIIPIQTITRGEFNRVV